MAENCPYFRNVKCANPNGDHSHDCSWPHRDFDQCVVYTSIADPARGYAWTFRRLLELSRSAESSPAVPIRPADTLWIPVSGSAARRA